MLRKTQWEWRSKCEPAQKDSCLATPRHFKTQYLKYLNRDHLPKPRLFYQMQCPRKAQHVCNDSQKCINKPQFCLRPDKVCQFQCWALLIGIVEYVEKLDSIN